MTSDRRALLVGIDEYDHQSSAKLPGCANDARRMSDLLSFHYDKKKNFYCKLLTTTDAHVTRSLLRKHWMELFEGFRGDILFYFSGHGMPLNIGGYLVTQEGTPYDPGLAMNELFTLANQSQARSALLILDCCHAAMAGNLANPIGNVDRADVREGVTLLAAAGPHEKAQMAAGRSLFTDLVLRALEGGAANLQGHVTAASIYGFVESSLGAWHQRPVYKSYASRLEAVRECKPQVDDAMMHEIMGLFPTPEHEFLLDPEYEDYRLKEVSAARVENAEIVSNPGDPKKRKLYHLLKRCQLAGLLRPKIGEHLFWAALYSESVSLTQLGGYYWRRLKNA